MIAKGDVSRYDLVEMITFGRCRCCIIKRFGRKMQTKYIYSVEKCDYK